MGRLGLGRIGRVGRDGLVFICGIGSKWKNWIGESEVFVGGLFVVYGGFVEEFDGIFAGALEEFEFTDGAGELAVEGGFMAEGVGEGVSAIIHVAIGDGGGDGGRGGDGDGGHEFGDFAVEIVLLDGPGAHLTPAGGGHVIDEGAFRFGAGAVFEEEGVDEDVEAFAGFAGEHDGLGEHAVAEVFAGGGAGGFAGVGGGAVGEGSVGAGGGLATVGGWFGGGRVGGHWVGYLWFKF